MKPDFFDDLSREDIEIKDYSCEIAFLNLLLGNNAIELPYYSEGLPLSEVEINWNYNPILLSYDLRIKEGMRSETDYFTQLRNVIIDKKNNNSLFYSHYIKSKYSDLFIDAYSKARNIVAWGDYSLLNLWTGHIIKINEDYPCNFIFSDVSPSMWMTIQLCKTQLCLVEEKEMARPHFVARKVGKDPDFSQIMETLGQYSGEEIKICPQRLRFVAENSDLGLSIQELFVIVYLHELAHAILDSKYGIKVEDEYNTWRYNRILIEPYKGMDNKEFDIESFTMEESLANMIMLKYLAYYSEKCPEEYQLFEKAKQFVSKQISEYSFGILQYEADVEWRKWREYKAYNEKTDIHLKKWYNSCFDNSRIKEDLRYTKDMYETVFL
jgi:hypothetical protein